VLSKIHKNPDIRGIWCSYWDFVPGFGDVMERLSYSIFICRLKRVLINCVDGAAYLFPCGMALREFAPWLVGGVVVF
jgi:hypothetical protein